MPDYLQKNGTLDTITWSTALDSLAINGLALSNVVNLTSANYQRLRLELVLVWGTAPAANTNMSVWYLQSIDNGLTYEDGSISIIPVRNPDLWLPLRNATTQRVGRDSICPIGPFRVLVYNQSGVALSASGNSGRLLPKTDYA